MRPSVVLALVVAAGAAAFVVGWPSPSPSTAPAAAAAQIEAPRPVVVAAAPTAVDTPKTTGFDPASDPRIAALRTEPDLVAYLDQLEAEARARGSSGDALARASAAGTQVREKVGGQEVAMRLVDLGERLHRMDREREQKAPRQLTQGQ